MAARKPATAATPEAAVVVVVEVVAEVQEAIETLTVLKHQAVEALLKQHLQLLHKHIQSQLVEVVEVVEVLTNKEAPAELLHLAQSLQQEVVVVVQHIIVVVKTVALVGVVLDK